MYRRDKTFPTRFPNARKYYRLLRFPLISIKTQKFCYCFFPIYSIYSVPQLKDFEAKKRKELQEKLQQFKENEDILKEKIQDLNKAGMEKQIANLKYQLGEARNEKHQWEREIRDLKDEIARLAEQLRLAQRPFWKRWFGIDS